MLGGVEIKVSIQGRLDCYGKISDTRNGYPFKSLKIFMLIWMQLFGGFGGWGARRNGGVHGFLSRDKMCKPKACGGLCIRRFTDINTDLLSKLGWSVAVGKGDYGQIAFGQSISTIKIY